MIIGDKSSTVFKHASENWKQSTKPVWTNAFMHSLLADKIEIGNFV